MKYLKSYENNLISTSDDILNQISDFINGPLRNMWIGNEYYLLEFIAIKDNSYKVGNATLRVDSEIITRLATPEEIKDYKLMKGTIKNMKKYNL